MSRNDYIPKSMHDLKYTNFYNIFRLGRAGETIVELDIIQDPVEQSPMVERDSADNNSKRNNRQRSQSWQERVQNLRTFNSRAGGDGTRGVYIS